MGPEKMKPQKNIIKYRKGSNLNSCLATFILLSVQYQAVNFGTDDKDLPINMLDEGKGLFSAVIEPHGHL